MMDKPHVVNLKPRCLAEDFVREAPKRRSLHSSNAVGRFLSTVFLAVVTVWVLMHGFERVPDMFRLLKP
jgi:hypothetical protein